MNQRMSIEPNAVTIRRRFAAGVAVIK